MAHTLIQPAQIAQAGASTGNVLAWNGTIWEPDTAGAGTVTGTGTTGRITQWNNGAGGVLENSTLIKSGAGVLTLSAASAHTLTLGGSEYLLNATPGGHYGHEISDLGGGQLQLMMSTPAIDTFITIYNTDTLVVGFGGASVSGYNHGASNPTASVGLIAVNGSAHTFMRSDGAPPLDVTIAPTWSGIHTFGNTTDSTTTATGAIVTAGGVGIAKALTVGGLAAFGTTPTAHQGLNVLITDANAGSNVWGLISVATANGTTTGARGLFGRADTTNASFTLADATSIFAANPIKGAASTITTAYGLQVASITTGGTNYAIFTGTGVTHLGGGLRVGADGGGAASTTGFTNATSATVTNTYIVRGGQAANTVNTGWIKIYIGTNAAWIPYWQNATP